ncbi:MAG: hypothetical protein ACHQ9S_09670 [Candidatus Binatia bacterium]|jgi:hypothetical protein
MKATTIKVEGELLSELNRAKPATQSISAYVRSVLKQEVLRRKVAEAAEEYAKFLRDTGEERAWLEEWDRADLAAPVRRKRR